MWDCVHAARIEFAYFARDQSKSHNVFPFLTARPKELHADAEPEYRPTRCDKVVKGLKHRFLVDTTHRCMKGPDTWQYQMRQRVELLRRIHDTVIVAERIDGIRHGSDISHLEVRDSHAGSSHFSLYQRSKSHVFFPGVIASKSG